MEEDVCINITVFQIILSLPFKTLQKAPWSFL